MRKLKRDESPTDGSTITPELVNGARHGVNGLDLTHFYNNFFLTDLRFWRSKPVVGYLEYLKVETVWPWAYGHARAQSQAHTHARMCPSCSRHDLFHTCSISALAPSFHPPSLTPPPSLSLSPHHAKNSDDFWQGGWGDSLIMAHTLRVFAPPEKLVMLAGLNFTHGEPRCHSQSLSVALTHSESRRNSVTHHSRQPSVG